MKDKLFWGVVILIGVALLIFGIINTFGGLDNIEKIGGGSLLVGFLKLPLCLFGGIQLLRGVYSVIGKDTETIAQETSKKSAQFVWALYLVCTIGGIMFFIDAYYKLK